MKISIALATYFGGKYIKEQLISISNQTRLPDEIIICDDASTDSTKKILEEFKNNVNFKCEIHHNKTNRGTGYTFKKAIDFCNGDIIFFCDQDDIWALNKIEKVESAFINNPEVEYIISNAKIVDEFSSPLGYTLWDQKRISDKSKKEDYIKNPFMTLFKHNLITGMSTAVSSKIIKLGAKKPPEINHDAWYIYLAALHGYKGLLIEDLLVSYRQHDKQQFGSKKLNMFSNFRRLLINNICSIDLKIKNLAPMIEHVELHKQLVKKENIKYLRATYEHFKRRKKIINADYNKRLCIIIYEVVNGNYNKYSNIKNVLVDLFCEKQK